MHILSNSGAMFDIATTAWKNVNFLGSLLKFPMGCKLKMIALLLCGKRYFFS